MGNLVYKDQSAALLRLTIAKGKLDTCQFQIVEDGCIRSASTSVLGRIIGSSHFISFDTGSFILHEVFACQCVDADDVICCASISQTTDSVNLDLGGGINYSFSAETAGADCGDRYLQSLADWASSSEGLLFEYAFPATPDGSIPKTVVALRKDKDHTAPAYQAKTAHIYPNEQKVIITSSRLVLPHL